MSEAESSDAADEQNPDHADVDQSASESEKEKLDWMETQARFKRRQEERRTLYVDFSDGVAEFVVRGLDDDEQQEVEQVAAASLSDDQRRRGRQSGGVDLSQLDTKALKDVQLKHGIVSGPDGFKPHREDHRDQLAPGVKDQLVDAIEDLSSLDVHDAEQFP